MTPEYPILSEAHDWAMDTYALEANHVADIVLDIVYRLAGKRTIFFRHSAPRSASFFLANELSTQCTS